MGNYGSQANDVVNQVAIAIANWSTAMAVESVKWLLATLGQSTEPDLAAIAPVYDRMLAIALLLVGAIIALALIERIAWGTHGAGLAIVPRVVAATFFAFCGLAIVQYVADYSALLATAWSPDFSNLTTTLLNGVASSDAAGNSTSTAAHVSTLGLIVTALTMSCLTVVVHLELVIRSALILTVTSFVPLISVLSIWPRLARTATTMAEFLIGLLLSKFVVATAVYVGFRLVVTALVSPVDSDTTENWMASGVAVLLIAALSPLVIFQAVRVGHTAAGQVARGWIGGALAFAPPTQLLKASVSWGRSLVRVVQPSVKAMTKSKPNAQ